MFPIPFGDNFNHSVDHFDGGLIINRIRWPLHPGGPSLCISHGVSRQHFMVQMRKYCKINETQRFIAASGWSPANEEFPMLGAITILPALSPT